LLTTVEHCLPPKKVLYDRPGKKINLLREKFCFQHWRKKAAKYLIAFASNQYIAATSFDRKKIGRQVISPTRCLVDSFVTAQDFFNVQGGQMYVSQMSVGQMSVGKMSVSQMSIGQMSVSKMSVSKMSVGKMYVGKMSVGKMSVGKMSVGQILIDHKMCILSISVDAV
jgi:hypothetical protein